MDFQVHHHALHTCSASSNAIADRKQCANTNVLPIPLEMLLQTSPLHPTEFLQSSSRRGASLESPLGEKAHRPRSRLSLGSASHTTMATKPLSPVTDMSTFREQSNRRRKSCDTTRLSSKRRGGSGSRPATLEGDVPRPRSGKAVHRPSP